MKTFKCPVSTVVTTETAATGADVEADDLPAPSAHKEALQEEEVVKPEDVEVQQGVRAHAGETHKQPFIICIQVFL